MSPVSWTSHYQHEAADVNSTVSNENSKNQDLYGDAVYANQNTVMLYQDVIVHKHMC